MAFDAGSIVGHVDLKTGDFTMNADKVMGRSGGMAKSMFSAQVAFAAFQKVLQFVTGVVKDSVAEFAKHEAVVAQTAAVLKSTSQAAGITAVEVGNLASKLAGLSTYEDDAIQGAENLLLTFTKIGKDVFPQATEIVMDMSTALGQDLKSSAIQVGKALQDPILGVTALRRVGVNFNETQMETIKNLVKTGQSAKAQARIMKELQTEFGGSAKAARDTFGGALKALDVQVGEVKESIGAYIAAAGRPLVENMIEQAKVIQDWLKSAEGMNVISDVVGGIAAGFELIKQIVTPIVEAVWPALVSIGEQVKKSFTEIFGEGDKSIEVFTVLAGVSKGLALALTIVGKVIEFTIKTTGNLINAIKLSAESVGAFFNLLSKPTDPKALQDLQNKSREATAAWGKFVTDQVDGIIGMVETGVNGVKDIIATSEADGKRMMAATTQVFRDTKGNIIRAMTETKTAVASSYRDMMQAPREMTSAEKEWAEARKTLSEDETQTKLRHIREQGEAFYLAGADAVEVEKWVAKETEKAAGTAADQWKKAFAEVSQTVQDIVGVVQSTWNSISSIWNQALENETTANDNDYKRRKRYIEQNVTDEEDRAAQLAALDEEYAAKQAEMARKKFYADQASAVAGVVFATGVAVMQSFAQLGPVFGGIAAGIAIVMGAVQVGLILAEEPPEYAAGTPGVSHDQWGIVGERGKELAYLPRNTEIFSAEDTRDIMSGRSGGANVNFYGDIRNDVDVDRAAAMMAAKLEEAMRGAA
jgi:hypothetical protein